MVLAIEECQKGADGGRAQCCEGGSDIADVGERSMGMKGAVRLYAQTRSNRRPKQLMLVPARTSNQRARRYLYRSRSYGVVEDWERSLLRDSLQQQFHGWPKLEVLGVEG